MPKTTRRRSATAKRHLPAVITAVGYLILSGCTANEKLRDDASSAVSRGQHLTDTGSNLAEVINAKLLDHAHFGTRVTTNRHGQPFPVAWETPGVAFSGGGDSISLSQFAEKMTQQLGTPVTLDLSPPQMATDNAAKAAASPASGGAGVGAATPAANPMMATRPPGVTPAGTAPDALTRLINSANSVGGSDGVAHKLDSTSGTGGGPETCRLRFPQAIMPMSQRLLYVDAVCGVRSSYDGYRISVRRYVEEMLPVASFSSVDTYGSSMGGSTGSTQNGTAQSNTASGQSSSGTNASGSLSVSMAWTEDPYKELVEGIKARIPKVSVVTPNQSAHGITVVATPDAVDRARGYVDSYNRTVSRMVNVRVEILQASISAADNYGVDLTAEISNRWSGLTFGASGPSSGMGTGTSSGAGCASAKVPSTGYLPQVAALAGSSYAACALSTDGRAKVMANKLIPIHNGRTYVLDETALDDYISGTSSQGVTTTGVVTPTSVTTSTTFYGTKLMITPILLPDGLIRLRLRPIIQGKPTFVTAGSSDVSVQLRQDQQVREYNNEVSVQNGSTVVAYATIDNNSTTDDAGIGSAENPLLGGHVNGSKTKSAFVILVTPTEVDPMGRPPADVGITQ